MFNYSTQEIILRLMGLLLHFFSARLYIEVGGEWYTQIQIFTWGVVSSRGKPYASASTTGPNG